MTQQSSSSSPIGPDLRAALVAMVRKRVPESDVEDIVQATLTEAVVSPHAPTESDALRRWLFGVAKNKVADFHRRRGRESFDLPEVAGAPAPHQEVDLLRWAERNLPPGEDAKKTLDWMLREGDGEKLESIAESEHVPAPRVRQRVSRLRRHLKSHWQREVALLAALGVLVSIAVVLWLREKEKPQPIANDPKIVPFDPRAEQLRKDGLDLCAKSQWRDCVEKLDDAKRLDPAGDTRPEVKRARDDAAKALEPAPAPSAIPSAAPTTENVTPPPVPTTSAMPIEKALERAAKQQQAKPQPKSASTESVFPAPAPVDAKSFKGVSKEDTAPLPKNAPLKKKAEPMPSKPGLGSGSF